jgi:hypothetical protein
MWFANMPYFHNNEKLEGSKMSNNLIHIWWMICCSNFVFLMKLILNLLSQNRFILYLSDNILIIFLNRNFLIRQRICF